MRDFQKRINESEDRSISLPETPENIQWYFEQLMALINDKDFADEVFEHNVSFDALYTPSLEDWVEHDYRAEVQWENFFSDEQKKEIEDTANARLKEYADDWMDDNSPSACPDYYRRGTPFA